MATLDEDLLQEIRDSDPFRKALKRYRSDLIQRFIGQLFLSILIGFAFFIVLFPSLDFLLLTKNVVMSMLFTLVSGGSLYIFYNTIRSFLDLASQKIDIQSDIFMDIEDEYSFEHTTQHETACAINLVDAGTLMLPYEKTRRYKTGTIVYVIRTGFSKTLLDVIPRDEL